MSKEIKHVIIAVAGGDSILKGIARWMIHHGGWAVYFAEEWADRFPKKAWDRHHADGLIIQPRNSKVGRAVSNLDRPVVTLSDAVDETSTPAVEADNINIGMAGADHLIEQGLKHLAYAGARNQKYGRLRYQGFIERTRRDGLATSYINTRYDPVVGSRAYDREVSRQLEALPRPCGILCEHDGTARHLSQRCRISDISVPDEVALLGIDNNELYCSLDVVPLSSMITNHAGMGMKAAELLSMMMAGKDISIQVHKVPHLGIAVRTSTEILAVPDARVRQAINMMREHPAADISLNEMAARAGVNRRTLDRLFKAHRQRTAREEWMRLRLNRVKYLLLHTDLTIDVIAEQVGFTDAAHLTHSFTGHEGMSPGRWRSHHE